MIDVTIPIVPYRGTGVFNLGANYDDVKNILRDQNIACVEETADITDINPPWTIIAINKDGGDFEAIELFFVNDRLFQICLSEDFEGALPNGIHTGMDIETALSIDGRLHRAEDFRDVYVSPEGYRVETFGKHLGIVEIAVFTRAAERNDFYKLN